MPVTALDDGSQTTSVIPDLPFRPGVHVHYQESVLPIKDGVPKQKDVPKEMGGSGATVAE